MDDEEMLIKCKIGSLDHAIQRIKTFFGKSNPSTIKEKFESDFAERTLNSRLRRDELFDLNRNFKRLEIEKPKVLIK